VGNADGAQLVALVNMLTHECDSALPALAPSEKRGERVSDARPSRLRASSISSGKPTRGSVGTGTLVITNLGGGFPDRSAT
jgi:hypothetical protein